MPTRFLLLTLVVLVAVLLQGCAQTTAFKRSEWSPKPGTGARVLLMTPDIELYELTVGGLLEPKADWTASAHAHITTALKEELAKKGAQLVLYQPPKDNPAKEHSHIQLVKLHDAVGGAILTHQIGLGGAPTLPTKAGNFDWSLGHGTNVLQEDYNADYGLFILIRDSYASAGRIATLVIFGALSGNLGVLGGGGRQVGFASLVDLLSGDVLWFNWLTSGTGDLRAQEPAQKAVRNLLADFPL